MKLKIKGPHAHGVWLAVVICICFFICQHVWLNMTPVRYCQNIMIEQISIGNSSDQPQSVTPTPLRTVYVITPTYRRRQQIAELTRLSQTLMHVPDLVWLVIEDEKIKTKAVEELLTRTGVSFVHLVAPMPEKYKRNDGIAKPRGVSNRNRGLEWLRANATSGVFFFADDDNSYDIRLFEEMRDTKRVSMWPVGLLSAGFSSPIIYRNKLIGFYEGWIGGRTFPVDMAGFAVSVEFLLERPNAKMPFVAGYEEDGFLRSLFPFLPSEVEIKASNCTKILVWHTQTRPPPPLTPLDTAKYNGTNLLDLYATLQ